MGNRPPWCRGHSLGRVLVAWLGVAACGGGDPAAPDAATTDDEDARHTPTILAIAPADGATAVAVGSPIVVRFSHAMAAPTVTVTLTPAGPMTSAEWNPTGDVLRVFPMAPLAPATAYTVAVAGTTRDGAALTGPLTSAFATATAGDTFPPEVVDLAPGDGAPCTTPVAIAFSEPMDPRTLVVTTRPGHGLGAPLWAPGLRRVAFPDTPPWPAATEIDLDVAAADLAGNAGLTRFRFTTCPQPVAVPVVTATYPAAGATGVASGTHVRITFSEPMDPTLTALAISTAPPLACGAVVDDHGRTFTCATATAKNTTYVVTVLAASDPFAAVRATSQAGVLLPNHFTFTFQTGALVADITAPRVTSISPPDGTHDAPLGTAIVVDFDEEMDPTSGTLTLATSSPVDRAWTTPPTQVTYRFASDAPDTADVTYTLADFRDVNGNALAPVTAGFATAGRTVDIATSDPARDGDLERAGAVRGAGTTLFVGVAGTPAAPRNTRGVVSFALPAALLAHTGVTIHRAYLVLHQTGASATTLTAHNPLHVASIAAGATVDAADYAAATLPGTVEASDVFDGTTLGLHVVDVTAIVADTLAHRAERAGRADLRLAFAREADGTLGVGLVGIAAGESATPPQLWIDYGFSR